MDSTKTDRKFIVADGIGVPMVHVNRDHVATLPDGTKITIPAGTTMVEGSDAPQAGDIAAEREACAKLAESIAHDACGDFEAGCDAAAEAIRARK